MGVSALAEPITDIQLIRPKDVSGSRHSLVWKRSGFAEGKEWAIEITFDRGRKAQTRDLRPGLPLIIHY